MTDDELRALVRDVIARRTPGPRDAEPAAAAGCAGHASHLRLSVLPGVETGGPCLIEPRVPCNRCGYCQSYGH